ncbi:MAG: NAD-dependent epimerase/dehydratase family protein [Bdellovibrionales bacterium]
MKVFVTGGAGFIASHLCLKLLSKGYEVTAYDNLHLGKEEFLSECKKNKKFKFVKADLLDLERLKKEMAGHDLVYHMAANSDISQGANNTDVDLKLGTIVTYNTLEAMRVNKMKKMVFASTSAIYGEATVKPTPESYGPLIPISFYGASKLGCEALCTAFSHNCNMEIWIYRFANIVGSHATHGAIYDFSNKLKKNPKSLQVLGNGTQKKSYLHVSDCVDGMIFGFENTLGPLQIFNLASEGVTNVRFIAEEVARQVAVKTGEQAEVLFEKSDRGWVGDVAFTWLDGSRFQSQGYKPKLTSDEAIKKAINEIISEVFEE